MTTDIQAPSAMQGIADGASRLVPELRPVTHSSRPEWRRVRLSKLLPSLDIVAAGAGVVVAASVGAPLPAVVATAVPLLWPAALMVARSYQHSPAAARLEETAPTLLRTGAWLTVACLFLAAVTGSQLRPVSVLLVAGLTVAGSLVPRTAAELWRRRTPHRTLRTRVVVAGHHPREVTRLLEELRRQPWGPFEVAMVCLGRTPEAASYDVPVSVGLDRLPQCVVDARAEALIVLPCPHLNGDAVRRLGWELEASRTALYVGTPLVDVARSRTGLTTAGDLRMLHIRQSRHHGPARAVKAVAEWTTAALLLLLLLPVLAALWCAVRLDSAGPGIYRQTRIGRSGAAFTMYKFRTMTAEADRGLNALRASNISDGVLFKIRHDPRLTRLGAFLRRYSLDELPQLVNVLLGQMSLVGPRPALPEEVARYEPDARRRLVVKPGLTGLWQVSGRSDLSWADTVRMDLRYVDNWSLTLDLLILLRTARAVLGGRGAY